MVNEIIFLCGARDYHAMDWYRSAKALLPGKKIHILTDLIEGEGFRKLIDSNDSVHKLIILDKLLLKRQSRIGNIWRNILKLLIFPIQVMLLKHFSNQHPNAVYHAHAMYYLFLAWAAGIPYIGTPQGSEILLRPCRSRLYRYFAVKSLQSADAITVDSIAMKAKIIELSNVQAFIVQNGIDIDGIRQCSRHTGNRHEISSIRAMTLLYRIKDILVARNSSSKFNSTPITFIYPFFEDEYKKIIASLILPDDIDSGRIERHQMYDLFARTKLVISIPDSDSSPRSVYEAIFCGAAVAITYNPYYDAMPQCMKSRTILIDLNDKEWFDKAMNIATEIIRLPYHPSEDALKLLDQKRSFKIIQELFYN